MLCFEHGVEAVDDLDAMAASFRGVGRATEGRMLVEGEAVARINGFDGVPSGVGDAADARRQRQARARQIPCAGR
jgi:hypothetical protein